MRKIPLVLENKIDTFSMYVSNYIIAELWNLDTLRILDLSENETKKEQTLQYFHWLKEITKTDLKFLSKGSSRATPV